MSRWAGLARVAIAALIPLVALPASAAGLRVSMVGGAWRMLNYDKLAVWANSAEASVTVDNSSRGFLNLGLSWDNVMAGTVVTTPEGVVAGSSRDGAPVVSTVTISPADRQEWRLHPQLSGAYRFAVVGGTRGPKAGQGTYGAISRDMAQKGVNFAIHLGDAALNGNKRQLEEFREQLASFKYPTYVLPGHQDFASGGRKHWQALFGVMPVTFRIGVDRFVMLDNVSGKLDKHEEDWLQGTLGRDEGARRTFVFLHRPLVDVRPGVNAGMTDVGQVRRLLKVFKQHDVHTVFAGHIPMYARERRQGVTYVTSAGGGVKPAVPAASGGYHHWVRVDVDAGGAVAIAPQKIAD